jgi:L-amino acid N-acyltransferase YncA
MSLSFGGAGIDLPARAGILAAQAERQVVTGYCTAFPVRRRDAFHAVINHEEIRGV